jgi:type II secretion system protein H
MVSLRNLPFLHINAGFTLIELAVVLVILGVCASIVAAMARPDERASVALEAERLARLLELAVLESRLTGGAITWMSDGNGYRFLRHAGAGGSSMRDAASLRPRALPSGMTIGSMRIESSAAPALRLDFAPHALPPAFAMEMSFGAARATIAGSPIGHVRVRMRELEDYSSDAP